MKFSKPLLFNKDAFSKIIDSSFTKQNEPSKALLFPYKIYKKYYGIKERIITKNSKKYIQKFFPDVYTAQLACRQEGGLSGDFQWVRLAEIAKLVRYFKPKSICEFGCGGSSFIFADLLKDKNRFVSVEESEYWLEKMKSSGGTLVKYIDAKVGNRVAFEKDGEAVTKCEVQNIHQKEFDLVYVDGPTAIPLNKEEEVLNILDPVGRHMPNIDVELMWENKVFPKVIVIDGRRASLRRLIKKSENNYRIYPKSSYALNKLSVFPVPFLYHSILVRK